METLVINIPDEKSSMVKLMLKEFGVTIQSKTKARQLAQEINAAVKAGLKPNMDEIVAEVKAVRAGR